MKKSITNKCIYCLKIFHYRGREHVPNKAFGTYGTETWTLAQVCNQCNQIFSQTIDVSLARGTIEGLGRFKHGITTPKENFIAKKETVKTKIKEGELSGALVTVNYFKDNPKPGISLIPQVCFKQYDETYDCRTLDNLPTKEELDKNYPQDGEKLILIHAPSAQYDNCISAIEAKGIQFNYGGDIETNYGRAVLIEQEFIIDKDVKRAIAKILLVLQVYHLI